MSYFNNGSGAGVLEENNFYPFGLKHEGYNAQTGNPAYNYQYNGKELQKETSWSDYGARMYMSDIARWGVIDPLAEMMRRFTPYNYAYNNPISFTDPDGRKPMSWDDEQANIMYKVAPEGSLWWVYASGDHVGAGMQGGGDGIGDFFGQMNVRSGGGGGSATTFGETQAYRDIMALFGQTEYFKGIDFSKFGNIDPTPKRKYLKDQTNAYFGAIESVTQYQLDHSNWVDEYQGTMDLLGSMKEYFDSAGDHLGGAGYGTFAIDNLKTIKEVVEKFKNYNPSLASAAGFIAGTVGTSLKMEGDRFDQIMDIYKNAEYRYDQLHKTNPELHKGVTVNVNVVIGTNGGGYTNIMIYDISTHRYLSGGKIVHRN